MRLANTLFIMLAFLAILVGQTIASEDGHLAGYVEAISDYYDVSLDAVQTALDDGIADEELPVLFFIANQSDANPGELAASRAQGQSWHQIARLHEVTAADFYVQYVGQSESAPYQATYAKFAGLKRTELAQVQLTDTDIVNLVNLRFLYKHYQYSQHLIMSWAGEGKSFAEINQKVYASVTQMRTKQLAQQEN